MAVVEVNLLHQTNNMNGGAGGGGGGNTGPSTSGPYGTGGPGGLGTGYPGQPSLALVWVAEMLLLTPEAEVEMVADNKLVVMVDLVYSLFHMINKIKPF